MAAGLPAVTVACCRTGLASLLLALVGPRALAVSLRGLRTRQRAAVLLAGALLAAHFALFLGGLARTSLAAAVALISLEPVAVVLASLVAFGIRPTRREIMGLLLATLGAAVVALGAGTGEHRLTGDALVLLAVAIYGAYVAAARGLRDAMPAVPYAASVYGASALLLLPLALSVSSWTDVLSPRPLAAVVGLAVIPTLIGHTLVQTAARRASPVLVALVSPGETLGSLAIGAALMGVLPSGREAAGAALVLAGATLAVTARR